MKPEPFAELAREIAEEHGLTNWVYPGDDSGVLTTKRQVMAAIIAGIKAAQPTPAQKAEAARRIAEHCNECGAVSFASAKRILNETLT